MAEVHNKINYPNTSCDENNSRDSFRNELTRINRKKTIGSEQFDLFEEETEHCKSESHLVMVQNATMGVNPIQDFKGEVGVGKITNQNVNIAKNQKFNASVINDSDLSKIGFSISDSKNQSVSISKHNEFTLYESLRNTTLSPPMFNPNRANNLRHNQEISKNLSKPLRNTTLSPPMSNPIRANNIHHNQEISKNLFPGSSEVNNVNEKNELVNSRLKFNYDLFFDRANITRESRYMSFYGMNSTELRGSLILQIKKNSPLKNTGVEFFSEKISNLKLSNQNSNLVTKLDSGTGIQEKSHFYIQNEGFVNRADLSLKSTYSLITASNWSMAHTFFTSYPVVNTYKVYYKKSRYIFEFEEGTVTNFLRDDRDGT